MWIGKVPTFSTNIVNSWRSEAVGVTAERRFLPDVLHSESAHHQRVLSNQRIYVYRGKSTFFTLFSKKLIFQSCLSADHPYLETS